VEPDAEGLLAHGMRWMRSGDATAGWELVRGVRSGNREIRDLALSFLRQGSEWPGKIPDQATKPVGPKMGCAPSVKEEEVKTPYGLSIVDNCLSCSQRSEGAFCNFSSPLLQVFSGMSHQDTFPGGALLFVEGQTSRGVYVLCSGKVKLLTSSRDGKVLIVKIAEAGDVLGLSAAISHSKYEVTAETAGPCQVSFVEREALLRFMQANGEAGLRAALALSQEFQSAYRDIHDLVLARSSKGKLARLLLSWVSERGETAEGVRIRMGLTHEEMAQMIGASRETVTRLLSDLKRRQFITLEGSTLVIRNPSALRVLAS
jgi:CRP/FNR family transcriptional regulator